MTEFRVCLVTVPDREVARKIAEDIVKAELCACVNLISGIESIYHWQGKIEHGDEILLLIKTQQSCLEALDARIRLIHPYEVYEFIAMPVDYGNHKYLKWIHDSTT